MQSILDPFLAAARRWPGRPAWRHEGAVVDFSTLAERLALQAGTLAALGVGRGDRVALIAPNGPEMLEAYLAVAWAGAVSAPINTRLAPPEIEAQLSDAGVRLVLRHPAMDHLAAAAAPPGAHVAVLGPEGPVGPKTPPLAPSAAEGEAPAFIFYTGGTTAAAKGVVLSHRAALVNALNLLVDLPMDEDAVWLHAAPMFHLADMAGLVAVGLRGGAHAFLPSFDPQRFMVAVAQSGATHSVCVPTMINAVLHHGDFDPKALESLRHLLYGGSAISPALLSAVIRRLPGLNLWQAYGQTEAGPVLTVLPPDQHIEGSPRLASAGRAVVGVDLVVLDAHDRPVAAGEVGEVCARGLNVMSGYWGKPETTAATLRNGWLHTGDVGYLDADGYLFVVDRAKDMIVSGGENVYSAEVEAALASHPDVLECAVIGVPDPDWGERVHAVVRLAPGAAADAAVLLDHCRGLIARYKAPRSIDLRTQPLPLSGAGKVLKAELRRPFWEGRDRGVN